MPDSKRFEAKLAKRTARYLAFVKWAKLDYYPKPRFVRELLRGLINRHEEADVYSIHHQINSRKKEDVLFVNGLPKAYKQKFIKLRKERI